ncbi:MAG: YdcF family protein [Blastocatellia bacterium]
MHTETRASKEAEKTEQSEPETAWFRFQRRARPRMMLFLALAAFLLYLGLSPLMSMLARGLIRRDELVKSDVIVALGGDVRCNRERRGAELYHQGWAPKIVISGVQAAWGIHTADAGKRYLISLGVPPEDIFMIRDTLNTRTEIKALKQLMTENGWKTSILVTSAFHSRRAMFTAERAKDEFVFRSSPVPPDPPEWQPDRWWSRRGDLYITLREGISWTNTLLNVWQ